MSTLSRTHRSDSTTRLAMKIATEMNANPRHGLVGCDMSGNLDE